MTFSGTSDFSKNDARNGGAFYIASSVTFGGTPKFTDNTAEVSGGAIYLSDSGVATMAADIEFSTNRARGGDGGAIYLSNSSHLANNSSTLTFKDNEAGDYGSSVEDPTKDADPTEGFGGAICFATSGTSYLGTVTFNGNIAQAGGAIASTLGGTVNFSGTASFGDSAENTAWLGGAIYLTRGHFNFRNVTSFQNNKALDHGGAIYAAATVDELKFRAATTFTNNQANADELTYGDGGAVWWGGKGSEFKTAFTTGSDEGVTFSENSTLGGTTAVNNGSGNGGAIYFDGTDTLTFDAEVNITFKDNTATNSGGAIATENGSVTFEGIEITDTNTANANKIDYGGGLVYSAKGTVTVNDSTIANQNAIRGGAIYAFAVEVNGSTFSSNGGSSNVAGGALYSGNGGSLTIEDSAFFNNKTTGWGGAAYSNMSNVEIENTYFANNSASGNGGALELDGTDTTITSCTFNNNSARYGGAINVGGEIEIYTSYFLGNSATGYGGAIYFFQQGTGNGKFLIKSSMLTSNVADDGQGGGIYLAPDVATIDSCTFSGNSAMNGADAKGGGLYLDVSGSASTTETIVDNCTFYDNQANNGSNSSSGGGLAASGNMRVRSSAFLNNTAATHGGGIFIDVGTVEILGSIVVGNNAPSDIYTGANDNVRSGGYNRIANYETSNGRTDWKASVGGAGDESDSFWTMSTFYSTNKLDDNIISETIPPKIGSTLAAMGQIRLQTIALSEDKNLALDLRAVNIIPYRSARFRFPQYDERGVDRRAPGIDLDIGPVYFGPIDIPSSDKHPYEISRIILSGVPNEMRRIGQTASLIAKVYYTNRMTVYAGNADGEEPVTWSVSPTGYLSITNDGVITALRLTTQENYVTVTVRTQRPNSLGEYASDVARVKIVESDFGEFNISPEPTNSDAKQILRDLRYDFTEYNMGYGLIDRTQEEVYSDVFKGIFGDLWSATPSVVSSFTNSEVNLATAYNSSDGYTPSKGAGFTVSFAGVNTGDLAPVVFPWKFSSLELQEALGSKIYANVLPDIEAAYTYGVPISYSAAEEIFSALRFKFEGKYISLPVIGDDAVSISDAIDAKVLQLEPVDGGRGLLVKLTASIANVYSSGSEVAGSTNSSGAKLINNKVLVIPDGSDDGEIYGTMWLTQNSGVSTSSKTTTSTTTGKTSDSGLGGSSGGGGGCASVRSEELGVRSVLLLALGFGLVAFKKRRNA